jgi:hypothetical protein
MDGQTNSVPSAEACIAMEVLVEQDQITPVRILLKLSRSAIHARRTASRGASSRR